MSIRPAGIGTALVAILALDGCRGERMDDSGVVRADSAGVRIITSRATDTSLAWTFERVHVLRDSGGVPWLFTTVWPSGVLTDRGGRTYVLTRDQTIIRFAPDGNYDRTMGRKGGGPGEMELPVSLGSYGDTLYVHDVVKQSLVRWASSLEPLGDRRLEGALESVDQIAMRTGGAWFVKRVFGDSAGAGTFLFGDTLGTAPLLSLPSAKGTPADFGCVRFSGMEPIFSPALTSYASGPRLLANAGPSYDVRLFEGPRLIASIRRAIPSRAPTVEDVRELYPTGMRVAFGSGTPPCVIPVEDVFAKLPLASTYPLVHDLILLSDGTIWVQRTLRDAEVPVLDVFASDGAYVGTVRGRRIPVGRFPNGDLLMPEVDEATGGVVVARVKVTK